MRSSIILLIAAIAVVATTAAGDSFYTGKDTNVVTLTTENFAKEVFGSDHIWLVEFYAPWCGHCKSLKPEYEKAAKNMKGLVKMGAINCDEDSNKQLCGQYDIKGFPTIKFFPSELVPNPKAGKGSFHKVPQDYQGGRTSSDMVKFATAMIPSFVQKVTDASIDKFITSSKTAKAVLFTNKPKTSNLYKGLSVDFHHTLPLGEARDLKQETLERFKVSSFPTLVLFKSDATEEFELYDGKLDFESLHKFLAPHQNEDARPKAQQQKSSGQQQAEPKKPEEPALDHAVLAADQATFDKYCSHGLCSVFLFDLESADDADSNQRYIEMLDTLAKKFVGRVKVLYMDGSIQSEILKEFDLSGLPNMFVVNTQRMKYAPYLGSYSDESIGDFYERILLGKKGVSNLKNLPKVISATAPAAAAPAAAASEKCSSESPKADGKCSSQQATASKSTIKDEL
eukprot:gene1520-1776_t